MNRSIGVRGQAGSLTGGKAGRRGATKAQCCVQGAPLSTQRFRRSICPGLSGLPLPGGRHDLIGIGRRHSADQFAVVRLAGDDRLAAAAKITEGSGLGVEPQLGFPLLFVRTVTGEAVFRENRQNLPVEVDIGGWDGRQRPVGAMVASAIRTVAAAAGMAARRNTLGMVGPREAVWRPAAVSRREAGGDAVRISPVGQFVQPLGTAWPP